MTLHEIAYLASRNLHKTIDYISLVGFGITILQIRKNRKQSKKQNNQTSSQIASLESLLDGSLRQEQETRRIADSLSTKFLGEFPDYLKHIPALIAESETSLIIMASLPSHGEYTAEGSWHKISHAFRAQIEQKRNIEKKQFDASLLCSSKDCVHTNFDTQHRGLSDRESWKRWRDTEIVEGRLPQFFKKPPNNRCTDIANLELSEYKKARVDRDMLVRQECYVPYFRVFECRKILPLFCWIAKAGTSRKAIFSLKTEDNNGHYQGAGFITSDPLLINTFDKVFENYVSLTRSKEVQR